MLLTVLHRQYRKNKEVGFKSLSMLVVITLVGNIVLTACRPGGDSEAKQEAQRVADVQALYLENGIGRQAVDLLRLEDLNPAIAVHYEAAASYPSPYLWFGGFSLDPKWYSNRIRIADLPSEPVDLQQALGVTGGVEDAPDLKVVYYPGDELVLGEGSKLRYQVNENLEVVECLNNPSQNLRGDEDCDPYIQNGTGTKSMLVIERDQFSPSGFADYDQTRYTADRFSGTIIFAKRIVLTGQIMTGGYDLVLVADEIESWPSAKIFTTPPDRPHDDGESGGAYEYGRGGPGYRAGDLVLLGRRISGSLDITTMGGRGQLGADNQSLQCQETCRACKIESDGYIPEELTDCQPCPAPLTEPPGWVVDVGYRCSGSAGVGGQGGDAGHVTIIGSDMPFEIKRLNQVKGGPGDNGKYPGPKPYGPKAVVGISRIGDMEAEEAFAQEDDHGHGWVMDCLFAQEEYFEGLPQCEYNDQKPPWVYTECDECGAGYYCSFVDPRPSYLEVKDNISGWCDQVDQSGYELPVTRKFYCPVDPNGLCPEPAGIVHRHCQLKADLTSMYDCKRYPRDFERVNTVRGGSGQSGAFSWYVVDVPLLLKPLERGVADTESSFEKGTLQTPTGAGDRSGDLSNLDYVQAMHALAPRSAELLLLKADYLYRSLTDSDLKNEDEAYVANADMNPNAENRILKAQYFYDSVMYLAPDAVEGASTGDILFSDGISPENPFRAQIELAYARKRQLLQGRNYFGFFPDFYLYAKPSEVRPYLDDVISLSDDSRTEVQTARDNVAALVVGRNAAAIEMDLNYGYEVAVYESELTLVEDKLRLLASRMDMALEQIDDNSQKILDTLGDEVTVTECESCVLDSCVSCVLDSDGHCLPPTIRSEIALLEKCAEQKPCDFGCWWDRVMSFAKLIVAAVKLVYGIVSEDWAMVFVNLDKAMEGVQNIDAESRTFVTAVEAVGEYVDLLINGDAAEPLRKGVEQMVDVGENVAAIVSGADDMQLTNSNRIAEEIANIVISSDTAAQGLQQNLTEIYHVQGEIDHNWDQLAFPRWAWGHAKSLEDLIKYNQSLNREIPDMQQEHVLAAQEYALALTEWEVLKSKIGLANDAQAFLNRIASNYDEAIVGAQADLDVAVRHANLVQDRLLLLSYFYTRSRDFLYLSPPTDFDFTTNLLLKEDALDDRLESADSILALFFDYLQTKEDGYVFDTIAPARYRIQYADHLSESSPVITARTEEEVAQAMCPEQPPRLWLKPPKGCSLTKVAYDDQIVNQLRETGVASFQIYPESLPAFRDLGEDEKREWNWSFSSADFHYTRDGFENWPAYKKRVVDVGARFLMDDQLYEADIAPKIRISHGPIASFLVSGDEREKFIFPPMAMQDACIAANSLMEDEQVSCESFEYFYKEVHWPPSDLGTLDEDDFETYHMFGTSLRGTWTIDITEFLSQLSATERDEFWDAFRGIQYQVYFVSIQ